MGSHGGGEEAEVRRAEEKEEVGQHRRGVGGRPLGQSWHQLAGVGRGEQQHGLGQSFGDLQLHSKVEQYVRTSGHWDVSKVSDMNTSLIREFIRLDLFLKALDLDNSLTGWWLSNTASVLGARRS